MAKIKYKPGPIKYGVLALAVWMLGSYSGKKFREWRFREISSLETKVVQPVQNIEETPRNKKNTVNFNNYAVDANNIQSYGVDANKPTRVSKNGIELIKQFERFSSVPYDDVGRNAIGYGHRIRKGENFYKINEEDAKRLLARDLALVESIVSKYVEVPLNQNQYDALCSFVCNVGEYNFKGSTLLKKLNKGNYEEAAEEIKRWVHVYEKNGEKTVLPGLVRRRAKEIELFLSN